MRITVRNILFAVIFIFIFSAAASLGAFAYLTQDLPSISDIGSRQIAQSTKIYDRTGEVLLYEIYGDEKRTVIPFENIPQYVKDATISVEDDNFYYHPAFDWRATLYALFVDVVYGRRIGGSTITQQLAKNLFFTPEKKISRKVREIVIAFRLEEQYSKDEILGLYLNQIPYGTNAYGVEAASQTYFNKPASELNLSESALLAALPKAPSYYSPWGPHKNELLERKDFVLKRMEELGYIDEQQRAYAEEAVIEFAPRASAVIRAPHFVIAVQAYLSEAYGEDFLRRSGLRVTTTLDWDMQQKAEDAVLYGAERNTERYQGHNAALVAQDTRTGQVLAMVGSKNYFGDSEPEGCVSGTDCRFEGNFNVATQGLRQPGSAMKPFGYIAAFKKGYTPQTIVFDVPTEFAAGNPRCPPIVDFSNEDTACFHPQNFDHVFRGPIRLRDALAQSINIPAVKVLYLAGIDEALDVAHKMGITTLNERSRYGLSLMLGGGEVTLADIVGAYSVFAQSGIYRPQTLILEVADVGGNTLEKYAEQEDRVIDAQYANILNDILSDVSARAPLFKNSLNLTTFPGREIALKTGTTDNYKDAWAIGYTPSLVVGVWAGNNNAAPMQRKGGSILAAVPIWHDFLSRIIDEQPIETFPRPDPIITEKPILNGDYSARAQIHTILFYVDKKNPRGPIPQSPQNDSQFQNWEEPILSWAQVNIPNFINEYNKPVDIWNLFSSGDIQGPRIQIRAPVSGDFIGDRVYLRAGITSALDIVRIETYLNDERVDQRAGNFGTQYDYSLVFTPASLGLQNALIVRAWDSFNTMREEKIILYR